jgi:integral membrane sensor domain MASE1
VTPRGILQAIRIWSGGRDHPFGRYFLMLRALYLLTGSALFATAIAASDWLLELFPLPIWPPAAIALGAVLWKGSRIWPALFIGTLLATMALNINSVVAAIAMVLQPQAGKYVLDKFQIAPGFHSGIPNSLLFVFFVAIPTALIAPFLGSTLLLLQDVIPPEAYWPTLSIAWLSHAMGILCFTPPIAAYRPLPPFPLSSQKM